MRVVKKFILSKIRKVWSKMKEEKLKDQIVNVHHDVSNFKKTSVADMRKYGFSFSESGAFNLKENDYREYITTYEAYKPRLSSSPYFIISDDKYLFSLVFSNYIETSKSYAIIQNGTVVGVDNVGISNSNLYDFVLNKGGAVVKDRSGCDGFDVYVFNVEDNVLTYKDCTVERREFDSIIKKFTNGLVQCKLVQGNFENNIFNKSVNTIRVVSMRRKDSHEHEIVAALQRIGTKKSMPVDNFNQGGGSALIDIETGELGSMTCLDSYDENGKRVFYDVHPDSGAKIKGLVIPNWEGIKQSIVEITKVIPFFDYIAWDIVLKDDGIAIIETNMKSSLNVFQVHGGMRNRYLGKKYHELGYLDNI